MDEEGKEVMHMEDSQIIDLLFERSEQAIAALSEKYEKLCCKIAANILRNEEDVRECLNDVWLGVWNAIPPHRPENLKTFLLRIVRNTAVKKYHANTAVKRNSFYDVALQELADCLADANDLEQVLARTELENLINSFLATQKSENRIIFVRRYYFSDSIPQIAERMHMTQNNVSVRLNRIRNALRTFLEKEGVEL